ncbi:FAD-dependent oxidoreductase [Leucobacter sp. USHLN153]|uniref:FAD-dependent oxidoreductase n=1 Tax=Leucobacter sp. USHLN153 TaxID=3081268 RepID=UPI003019BADA
MTRVSPDAAAGASADDKTFDVAIVGAGPAGLAAAAEAAEAGVSVLVVDSAEQPGGQYWRHRSERAGSDDGALHHGWRDYLALRGRFDAGIAPGAIRYLPGTSVWMAESAPGGFVLRLAPAYGPGPSPAPTVRATSLVLATGGYDRQLPVPGWHLPGVMAAGGIQAFVKQNGALPGRRFVIAGTGPFLLPVAANIAQSGGSVVSVLESASLAGWLPRAHRALGVPAKGLEAAGYIAAFARHRIPYRTRSVVTEILGSGQVEAVRTARVDRDGAVVPGSQRIIEGVDGVGLGWGFTPQLELPVQLGARTRQDADGSLVAEVDAEQRSSVPGLYIAGELTGVGGAVLAVLEGAVAGRAAALTARGRGGGSAARTPELRAIARQRAFARAMHLAHPVPRGWEQHLHDDTVVCRCEEVRYGALAAARDTLAGEDSRAQKGVTRAGMGWCQGRVCGFAVSCIAGAEESGAEQPGAERTSTARSGSAPTSSVPMTAAPPVESLRQTMRRPIAQPIPLASLATLEPEAELGRD